MMSKKDIIDMKRQEEREREESFARIAAEFTPGVADALKDHFAIYDERFYLWLADLYDPGKYSDDGVPLGGGFYYSNSARDNAGFGIDVESTNQALNFLRSSGMLRGYNNDYVAAFPERVRKEIIAFTLSLQCPENGYFYHPQWGRDITPARLSRDIGSAVDILQKFGLKPNWDTPSGVAGVFGTPSGCKKADSLGNVVVKQEWPERLRSLENWKAYMDGFREEIHTNSYSVGHTVGEQSMQLINRDKEAKRNGEPMGYVKYTADFFNEHQKLTNGLWQDKITYQSVNGLMKTMHFYKICGVRLEYAERAFDSAVGMLLHDGPDRDGRSASDSVSVYNPWVAIDKVLTNVRDYGDPTLEKRLRASLIERAEEMIRATTRKTLKFKKEDGSYGYWLNYSPDKSQGAPASVPKTVEGDVNGGTIAVTGITAFMLNTLGIKDAYIFAPSDFDIFISRLEKRSHLNKRI